MRWGSPNDSVEGVNFDDLFKTTGFNTVKFLKLDNVVQEVKRQNEKATEKLIQKQQILKELLTICLMPNQYCHPEIEKLTNEHTYKAIEILSNLTQQFATFLLTSPDTPKIHDDDDVVTEELCISQDSSPNPLFLELMRLLNYQKPIEETALAYLVKILTSLCYQKPKQIILTLVKSKDLSKQVFDHFYSRSIYQWFTRILEIEDSCSFYEKQKLLLFKQCVEGIKLEQNQDLLIQKLQNYESIFQNLLQKIDDRFDKAKFSSMVKQLLIEQDCLTFLFEKINEHTENKQIQHQIFSILEIYLKFSSNHRSINASKNSDNLESSVYEIRLNNDSIKQIKSILQTKWSDIIQGVSANKKNLRSFLELLKAMLIFDSDYIPQFITKDSVQEFLNIMIQNPNNNIFHNLVKDILIESINKNYSHMAPLLLSPTNCVMIEASIRINGKNAAKKNEYDNQIFHILQTLIKKGEQNIELFQKLLKSIECQEQIITNLKDKEKFYSTMIGGNARKQSSCWGDSSAEIIFQRIFPNTTTSEKKIDLLNPRDGTDFIQGNQNQHWFDCGGLPLDSDQSRDENSGHLEIQNCLSPRSPRYSGSKPHINLGVSNLSLKEQSIDSGVVLCHSMEIPLAEPVIQIHNNSDIEIIAQDFPSNIAQNNSNHQGMDGRSFNTFFVTYQSFQLDSVLFEIE